jgi:hypothetical protein
MPVDHPIGGEVDEHGFNRRRPADGRLLAGLFARNFFPVVDRGLKASSFAA